MKSYKKMFGTKTVPGEISYQMAFSKVSLGLTIAHFQEKNYTLGLIRL